MVDPIPASRDQHVDRHGDLVRDEIADLLHAVNQRIRTASHGEPDPDGITPAQARALRTLDRAGGPMRMSDLADRLRIARRSATGVIDELAARGLVARRHAERDRRSVIVEPTAAGRETLARFAARRRAATTGLVGSLSPDDQARLRDLLARLVDADPAP